MAARTVLVIENDPKQIGLIRDELTDRGFRVESASEGDEGIAKARELLPYFTLVDFHLSERSGAKNGIDVLKALRADPMTAHLTVLAITATAQGEESAQIRRAGFDGVIVKPFEQDVFEATVLEAIAKRTRKA